MTLDRTKWQSFFILAALEAGAAFFVLALIPRGAGGFSITRLVMLGLLAAAVALWAYCAWRAPASLTPLARPAGILALAWLSFFLAVVLFLLRYAAPEVLLPYYQRLGVILLYILAFDLQLLLFLIVERHGFHSDELGILKRIARPAIVAFALLILTVCLIVATRVGVAPDPAYRGEPGVPVMGWQLVAAILAGLGILLVGLRFAPSRWDVWIAAGLWVAAAVIWLSVPLSVMQNSFYAPIGPPANQPFPNSDAGYYDSMAHSLLIGYPYLGEIPTRPLYVVLLSALHLALGERYDLIIAGQTLVLALIPVMLYFLGSNLHSRAAGIIAALIAVFREWTTLLVSSQTRVSDTKTLLVDLPTLLLILGGCLAALGWLRRRDKSSAVVAGGVLGLLLLLRTQSVLILPFLLLLAALTYREIQRWAPAVAWFLGTLAIVLLPWLLHNYLRSGQLTLDAPFQYQIVASQYRYTGNLDINSVDLQGKSLIGTLLAFAVRDPAFVLGFIATHSLATQINCLLALPLIEPYNGLSAPINLYWLNWSGQLSWFNFLLVVFYLAIIALGLGAAWRRFKWIGLLPLAFSFGYSLANGIGRFSGWRYDLPADWVAYFYFAIGTAEVLSMLALLLGANATRLLEAVRDPAPTGRDHTRIVWVALGFMLIGALPWFAERLAAPRYAGQIADPRFLYHFAINW